jgi:hypothetical protein
VVMVLGEVLVELVARKLVGTRYPSDHTRVLENVEVPIRRALCQTPPALDDFGHDERAAGAGQHVDQLAPTRGVTLLDQLEPHLGRSVDVHTHARLISRSPRMYGQSTSGTFTEPSGCRFVSTNAAHTRGTASADPFKVWTKAVPPPDGR